MIWAEAIANQGLQCVTKDVLSALEDYTGYFALCNGDYIVPGICDGMPSAGQSIKAFLQTYDVLQITAGISLGVDRNLVELRLAVFSMS